MVFLTCCRCNCPEQDPKLHSCNKLIIKSFLLVQDFSLFVWPNFRKHHLKAVLQSEHSLSSTNKPFHFSGNEVVRNSFFVLTKHSSSFPHLEGGCNPHSSSSFPFLLSRLAGIIPSSSTGRVPTLQFLWHMALHPALASAPPHSLPSPADALCTVTFCLKSAPGE